MFVASENIVRTLKWHRLIAKKLRKSSFYKEKSLGGLNPKIHGLRNNKPGIGPVS
jgi:hypothetical protein